jgi:signal transduction histidine kinase
LSIRKTAERLPLFSRMAFRLWMSMMALVLLCTAFLWVGQVFLFEHSYASVAMREMEGRLEPVMEEVGSKDLAENPDLIFYLSKVANGKLMLTDESGALLAMYTYGHPIDLKEASEGNAVWKSVRCSEEYQKLLQGEAYQKVEREKGIPLSFEIGIPTCYQGQRAYAVLYRVLNEIQTVLKTNRRQLAILSLLLTLAAALFAAVLARFFTRPIRRIKGAVDRLAAGELSAAPGFSGADEIGQLAGSVQELGRALQRVDVLRKEVIANVSHELRSPLALISGYAEMVRDFSWREESRREADLDLIIHEARRMNEMVNDILDYSQFQAGFIQLKKEWYNLGDIAESELSRCGPSAAENHIALELRGAGEETAVFVDALKLSQVLRNLLYNAINHTADGGKVLLELERGEKVCRVSVINPGEPIPEEERALIWERYQRSQHQGGRRQGTGLGLSIVSTILKAHDMPYGVKSRDGCNIFWFSVPVAAENEKRGRKR